MKLGKARKKKDSSGYKGMIADLSWYIKAKKKKNTNTNTGSAAMYSFARQKFPNYG